jgi:hypothetical protein
MGPTPSEHLLRALTEASPDELAAWRRLVERVGPAGAGADESAAKPRWSARTLAFVPLPVRWPQRKVMRGSSQP